jgi:hypothetical protein
MLKVMLGKADKAHARAVTRLADLAAGKPAYHFPVRAYGLTKPALRHAGAALS